MCEHYCKQYVHIFVQGFEPLTPQIKIYLQHILAHLVGDQRVVVPPSGQHVDSRR